MSEQKLEDCMWPVDYRAGGKACTVLLRELITETDSLNALKLWATEQEEGVGGGGVA